MRRSVETPGAKTGWTLSGCRRSDFLHHVVGNVEIRMHLLHIVMLIQNFHELEHLLGALFF